MFYPDVPVKFLYIYGVYQPLFSNLSKSIPRFTLHEGLPEEAYLNAYLNGEPCLIIIDDLADEALNDPNVLSLFVRGCHHRNATVILINQNLYHQGKHACTVALNASYLILFKNVRDVGQINCLGAQLFPRNKNVLVDAYNDCMKEFRSYLVLDLTADIEDCYRIRTKVLPGDHCIVYQVL